jgi:hypothetical protein
MSNPPLSDKLAQEAIDAYEKCGTKMGAARALNIPVNTFTNRYDIAVRRGMSGTTAKLEALHGWSPAHDMTHVVPSPMIVRGHSTLYKDGKVALQWVKTKLSDTKMDEAMRAAIDALASTIDPVAPIELINDIQNEDLLSLYVITDYHIGMLADADECGDNWDTKIAEKLFTNWFSSAIQLSPNSKRAVLCQLGDLLHTDGWKSQTPEHGHLLDSDTRFQKTVRATIRMIRKVVMLLLEKHKEVHIIMADANHDPASGAWLRELFSAMYDNESRITVDINMDAYYCVEHGLTSLFFHHGHKRKVENVDDVFVAKYRQIFGRTKFSYGHLGHLHSNQSMETNLMMVERHRTLAGADAYSTKLGYTSGRDAKVITYSKEFGEVSRLTISPDLVKRMTAI